jgi:hypothetical protein
MFTGIATFIKCTTVCVLSYNKISGLSPSVNYHGSMCLILDRAKSKKLTRVFSYFTAIDTYGLDGVTLPKTWLFRNEIYFDHSCIFIIKCVLFRIIFRAVLLPFGMDVKLFS